MGKRLLDRVELIRKGAIAWTSSDLSYRIEYPHQDELKLLSESFNQMSKELELLTKKEKEKAIKEKLEEQRKEFSRALHDRLGMTISAIKLEMRNLLHPVEDKVKFSAYESMTKHLNEVYAEIRELSVDSSGKDLIQINLSQTIEDLASRTELIFKIPITLFMKFEEEELGATEKQEIYLVIQEMLNNAVRHSQATNIDLQVIEHEKELIILLEDNGIGFDFDNNNSIGKGIKNCRDRIERMKGTLDIDSRQDRGTIINIEIPLKND